MSTIIQASSSYRVCVGVAAGGRWSVWAGGGAGGGAGRPPEPGHNINIALHLSQGGHLGYIMGTPRPHRGHSATTVTIGGTIPTTPVHLILLGTVKIRDEIISFVRDVLIYCASRVNIRFSIKGKSFKFIIRYY